MQSSQYIQESVVHMHIHNYIIVHALCMFVFCLIQFETGITIAIFQFLGSVASNIKLSIIVILQVITTL